MQLVRFELNPKQDSARVSWGIRTAAGIADLGSGPSALAGCMLEAIRNWSTIRDRVEVASRDAAIVEEPVRLLSPVPEGGKLICIGLNYRDHAIESGMDIPGEPVVFNKLAGALCGPNDDIALPGCSQKVDYEAELVIVMGRRAWQVTPEQVDDTIFGYTCGNDVSARDWQIGRPGGQWLLGKSFPRFAPIGPHLIPREFISDPSNLDISLRINGETFQQSNTRQLIFPPRELISYLSQVCVLEAGDIIFTGTPPGVGMARKPPRFLKSGDECEVEIEHIGTLRNRFQ